MGARGVKHRDNEGNYSADASEVATTRWELHLHSVQAGRPLIFSPKYMGEIFELPHVKDPKDLPVWLEVMSLEPRVFDIYNCSTVRRRPKLFRSPWQKCQKDSPSFVRKGSFFRQREIILPLLESSSLGGTCFQMKDPVPSSEPIHT